MSRMAIAVEKDLTDLGLTSIREGSTLCISVRPESILRVFLHLTSSVCYGETQLLWSLTADPLCRRQFHVASPTFTNELVEWTRICLGRYKRYCTAQREFERKYGDQILGQS